MNIASYVKENSLPKKMIGYFFLTIGILGFFKNIVLGSIFITLGLGFITREGSEINSDNKTYRNVKSIFGIKFGKWVPCPKFEYVSVFKTTEKQTMRVITASTSFTNDTILLNLFYNGNQHITFYKTTDKKEAFRFADKIRFLLDIDILDATTQEKNWL